MTFDINEYEPLNKKKLGFTTYSEKLNGRVAMIGFTLLFLFEFITKQKLIDFFK